MEFSFFLCYKICLPDSNNFFIIRRVFVQFVCDKQGNTPEGLTCATFGSLFVQFVFSKIKRQILADIIKYYFCGK